MHPVFAVPATGALIYRAWSKKSLTPTGLVAATLTAIAHAYHPWNLPFVLLCVFFLAGTRVTHVSTLRFRRPTAFTRALTKSICQIKEDVKARLTVTSKGSSGGEGPRTHVQGKSPTGLWTEALKVPEID